MHEWRGTYLPLFDRSSVAQNSIRNHSTNHTSRGITREPERMPRDMFVRCIPHSSNQRETWTDGTFENAEQETEDHQTSETVCDRVQCKDDAPDEHEDTEIFSEGKFDEAEGDGI